MTASLATFLRLMIVLLVHVTSIGLEGIVVDLRPFWHYRCENDSLGIATLLDAGYRLVIAG